MVLHKSDHKANSVVSVLNTAKDRYVGHGSGGIFLGGVSGSLSLTKNCL